MTDREILSNAIDRAVANGYQFLFSFRELIFESAFNNKLPHEFDKLLKDAVYAIIFSHSFAKAFWGEEDKVSLPEVNDNEYEIFAWQYHLQQMVLEENPTQYLAKFL